ncbi:MAG: hypothetical protein AAFY05_05025 [Pseudomonadota bacterium]
MVLTESMIDQYTEMLAGYEYRFSANFETYNSIKDDGSKAEIGGEIDRSLGEVLKAANGLASALKCLETEKLPFFGRAALRKEREQLLIRSYANLSRMRNHISRIPKAFLDGAHLQNTRDVLREKVLGNGFT